MLSTVAISVLTLSHQVLLSDVLASRHHVGQLMKLISVSLHGKSVSKSAWYNLDHGPLGSDHVRSRAIFCCLVSRLHLGQLLRLLSVSFGGAGGGREEAGPQSLRRIQGITNYCLIELLIGIQLGRGGVKGEGATREECKVPFALGPPQPSAPCLWGHARAEHRTGGGCKGSVVRYEMAP
jgi:hypothetical protein